MPQVLMIAYYMSGDRNTAASAMSLDANLCVCIYGPAGDPRRAELAQFFAAKFRPTARRTRVCVLDVVDRPATEELSKAVKRRSDPVAGRLLMEAQVPAIAAQLRGFNAPFTLTPPSTGTSMVADRFGKSGAARTQLIAFWGMPGLAGQFDAFLTHCGFRPDGRYVFLWCKTGAMTAEKAHHYTDPDTWQALALGLSRNGWIPVAVGDDIGLRTEVSLTGFWNIWRERFDERMERDVQLAFWVHVAQRYGPACCGIGMRSGMVEVPALVGIRTLYLEEAENDQQTRMAAWLGKVDTWFRGVLPVPPGLPQQGYYLRNIMAHPQGHALSVRHQGRDLAGLVATMENDVKDLLRLCIYTVLRNARGGADTPATASASSSSSSSTVVAQPEVIRARARADALVVAELVFGYVDLDIRDARRMMETVSVDRIVRWVVDPVRAQTDLANYQRTVEEVFKTGCVQIQGMLAFGAKAERQPAITDRDARKESWKKRSASSSSSSSSSSRGGGGQSMALIPYRPMPALMPPAPRLVVAPGLQAPGPRALLAPPSGIEARLVDRAEYDQLLRVLQSMRGDSPGFFDVFLRARNLQMRHGF